MRKGTLFSNEIAVDLGTSSVLVGVRNRGVVLREPSVAAVDRHTGKVLRAGEAARQMLGRTPENLLAVHPLRDGVISDYTRTQAMLQMFLRAAFSMRLRKPNLLVCIPSGITEVEERAVVDAGLQAGARRVYLLEEPIAAAMGAGIDVSLPEGHMVVDIGGGTTDVAVVALNGVVAASCLKTAGDRFDAALVRYVRRKHRVLIGSRTAEEAKKAIGQVAGEDSGKTAALRGRCMDTGLPRELTLTAGETMEAFRDTAEEIVEAVRSVLERTPPELAADVAAGGILLTGGGSLLRGMDTLLTERTGMPAVVAEDPLSAVALGACQMLPRLSRRRDGVRSFSRRQQMWG